jgi:hypothetical protein
MSSSARPSGVRPPPVGSTLLVALLAVFLGYLTAWPFYAGILVAVVGVGAATALRAGPSARLRSIAPVPLVLALAIDAIASPLGLLPELAAGGAGLAFLAWLADDPSRAPGGVGRARAALLVPALALGIAWSSALLLPTGSATIGVAAALLVAAIAGLAYLVARPALFDREEGATY